MPNRAGTGRRRSVDAAVLLVLVFALLLSLFSRALTAPDPQLESVRLALHNVRAAIETYASQHDGQFPVDLADQVTGITDASGAIAARRSERFCFGPYIDAIPEHATLGGRAVKGEGAPWLYDAETGDFRSADAAHTGE